MSILLLLQLSKNKNREQTKAQELDKLDEERKKQEGDAVVNPDVEKFNLSKTFPSVVYLESGTLYLQGCQVYVEYHLLLAFWGIESKKTGKKGSINIDEK